MIRPDTLVIGAGAAGLSAACFCSGSTLVVERMSSPGRKLLATGGGRCNLTHDSSPEEMIRSFGRNARFTAPAIYHFPPAQIRAFFAERGVPTVVQPDGCVFPASQRATDVLQALLDMAKANGAQIQRSVTVERFIVEPFDATSSRITKVISSSGEIYPHRVILAAGGMSYPALGSDGSGFQLLRQAGLTVVAPLPALAGLKTVESWPAELSGIVLDSAAIRITEEGISSKWCNGEVLFTHQGLSAPPALELSGEISLCLSQKSESSHPVVAIELNMDRHRSAEQWHALFAGWRRDTGGRAVHNLLSGELPRNLVQILCRQSGLEDSAIARSPKDKLALLAKLLTACPLHVRATDGWDKAMLTRGGLSVKELNPRTLACRSISNLYCVGEVVDVDAPCGGYNLTWAFASGALAAAKIS